MSAQVAFAHPPAPSARAHLIRRLSATPSPRGEGFIAQQNSTDIIRVMLSKMSAFADMSHKCDKKSSRTVQRNFSEEKFLSGRPQSDCNRREGSPSLRLRRKFTHSCALRTQREFSRSAERDQRLCLWNPRAFEKARSKLWSLGRIAILRQHNMDKSNSCRIDVGNISVRTCKTS